MMLGYVLVRQPGRNLAEMGYEPYHDPLDVNGEALPSDEREQLSLHIYLRDAPENSQEAPSFQFAVEVWEDGIMTRQYGLGMRLSRERYLVLHLQKHHISNESLWLREAWVTHNLPWPDEDVDPMNTAAMWGNVLLSPQGAVLQQQWEDAQEAKVGLLRSADENYLKLKSDITPFDEFLEEIDDDNPYEDDDFDYSE